jgi:hypothetical protein
MTHSSFTTAWFALWFGVALILSFFDTPTSHAALSSADIEKLCINADSSQECGRRIEAAVTTKLTGAFIKRNGDTLTVTLLPESDDADTRTRTFTDKDDPVRGIAYAVWDYLATCDAVVLYVSEDANPHFLWIGRKSGKSVVLPADPVIAPDNKKIVTADFCANNCTNEIALWQINGDLPTKNQTWAPKEPWVDAEATWSSAVALNISYQKKGASGFSHLFLRLSDRDWRHVSP